MKETLEARILRLGSRAQGVNPNYVDSATLNRLLDEGIVSMVNDTAYCTAAGLRIAEVNEARQMSRDPRTNQRKLSMSFDSLTREELELLERLSPKRRAVLRDEDISAARKLSSRKLIGVYEKYDKRAGTVDFQIRINERGRRALKWSKQHA
jgi:hypothetical protein